MKKQTSSAASSKTSAPGASFFLGDDVMGVTPLEPLPAKVFMSASRVSDLMLISITDPGSMKVA